MEIYVIETAQTLKSIASLFAVIGWIATILWIMVTIMNYDDVEDKTQPIRVLVALSIITAVCTVFAIFIPSSRAMEALLK